MSRWQPPSRKCDAVAELRITASPGPPFRWQPPWRKTRAALSASAWFRSR